MARSSSRRAKRNESVPSELTVESKTMAKLITPQLWRLADGGDYQAMVELERRGDIVRRAFPNPSPHQGMGFTMIMGEDGAEWADWAQSRAGVMHRNPSPRRNPRPPSIPGPTQSLELGNKIETILSDKSSIHSALEGLLAEYSVSAIKYSLAEAEEASSDLWSSHEDYRFSQLFDLVRSIKSNPRARQNNPLVLVAEQLIVGMITSMGADAWEQFKRLSVEGRAEWLLRNQKRAQWLGPMGFMISRFPKGVSRKIAMSVAKAMGDPKIQEAAVSLARQTAREATVAYRGRRDVP